MQKSPTGKLVFVFVAGVEGCGHHGLNPVLSGAFERSGAVVVRDWRRFKQACNALWCVPGRFGARRALGALLFRALMAHQKSRARATGQVRVVIEDNSFPSGKHRDLRYQWRLHELFDRALEYADEAHLIGLYRHPIASTYSHRDWDGGIDGHARLLRDSLAYVNDQMASVTNAKRLIVHYEDLVDDPNRLAGHLAAFFGLPLAEVRSAFAGVKKSTKDWRAGLDEGEKRILEAIFDPVARSRWPLLADAPRASGVPLEH